MFRKNVRHARHKAKSEDYNEKLRESKGNVAAMQDIIRQLVPNTKSNSFAHKDDSETLKTKADNFNKCFAKVGKDTSLKSQQHVMENNYSVQLHSDDIDLRGNMFRPHPTDSNTITSLFKNLKNTNLHGADGISLKFLR